LALGFAPGRLLRGILTQDEESHQPPEALVYRFPAGTCAGGIWPIKEIIMSILERFGVSMDQDLLARFDDYTARRGYRTRSEAIRDLVRQVLVNHLWERPEALVMGTVTILYEHHARGLADVLADVQHRQHGLVVCATHVHVDAHNCLEVIVVQGPSGQVQTLADQLIATKGVKHGQLVCSSLK
jgi:CopG family nickel-responsive transcriptional regulator